VFPSCQQNYGNGKGEDCSNVRQDNPLPDDRKYSMKLITSLIIIACAGLLIGCAATFPPTELIDARQAYAHASAGLAAQLVPAELHKAQEALAVAEKSFLDDPASFRTRDLAYVANRKAKLAEALGGIATVQSAIARANKDYQAIQTATVRDSAK